LLKILTRDSKKVFRGKEMKLFARFVLRNQLCVWTG